MLAGVSATGQVEMVRAAVIVDATVVLAQSSVRETEMVIDAATAGEALISTSMSALATVTSPNAIGCGDGPLRREAPIGGDATERASTEGPGEAIL